jgi:host factor-I protein
MTQRKLIRPDVAEPRTRGSRRKQAPPEQTNAEEFYYLKQMAAKTPMVVMLTNGDELLGWIEWYDKSAIKLNRHDGPNLLIPKHNIRYMFKEEERKRIRRRHRARSGGEAPAESQDDVDAAADGTDAGDESES